LLNRKYEVIIFVSILQTVLQYCKH